MLDDGHAGICDDCLDKCVAAAGDDEVDEFIHLRHELHGLAVGAWNEEDAIRGEAGLGGAGLERLGDSHV